MKDFCPSRIFGPTLLDRGAGFGKRLWPVLVFFGLFWAFLGIGEARGQCTETVEFFSGSGSWPVPANVTSITVEVWGGGGRGGSRSTGSGAYGGGGGGGYSRSVITVASGNTYYYGVGSGSSSNSSPGGNSWFSITNEASSIVRALGGQSVSNNSAVGANGGGLGTGDVRYSGGRGADAGTDGGGGGSSAGTNANGGNATGSNGANAPLGGGDGGNGRTNSSGNGSAGENPGGGGGGARRSSGSASGGNGGNGYIRITYTYDYCAEFVSVDYGSSTWCAGEDRNISVTIRNGGTATWTNTSPDINIGVRWNPNGSNWNDFHVRTNANNLTPGETRTYTFTLRASNNSGGGYTTPLAAGTNNIRFDVVNEGNFWFRNQPGNSEYISPNISIAQVPTSLGYTNNSPTYCANQAITANNATVTGGATSFTVSPALPAGLNLNPSTGQITGTPTTVAGVPAANYTVTASNSCGSTTRVLNITISPSAPSGLNYTNNTVTYCAGSAIAPNIPSFGGGGPATSFTVSPALPAGLSLNTSTGQITGTPTTLTGVAATNYTVTASNSCGNTTRVVNITIRQVAEVDNMSQVACSGVAFSVTPVNGTNGTVPTGTTYTWTAPTVTAGTVTGGVAGSGSSITGTLTNTTNVAQPVSYTVTPVTNGCAGAPFQVQILLNPSASITTINQQVCSEGSFSVTPVNGTNGIVPANTNYTWTAPAVTGGVTGGVAGSGTSISGSLTNPTNAPQTATYTVTPITGTCVGSNFTVVVTVNPKPAVNPMTGAFCSNEAFSITPVNGTNGIVPAGTSYSWSAPSVPAGISGGAAGTGSSIVGTLTNSTNAPLNATYTITPTSGTCAGSPFTVTVTVNPSPVIPTQTPTICSGDAFTVNPTNGGATIVPSGTTYTWTVADNPNVTGESSQAAAQSIISQTLTNTSAIPQTVSYTVTPRSGAAGNCVGNPFTITVTVNPRPILNSPATQIRCSNVSASYTATSATPGTSFSWTRAAVAGISNPAGSGTGATATETLINTTPNSIDVVYSYTLTANGCTTTQTVRVTVHPTPVLTSLQNNSICNNALFSYSPTSSTSGASFTWTRAAVAGISNPAITTPQTSNPNEVLTNTTSNPVDVIYAYTITANGCSTTQDVTVRVNPTPTLSSSLNPPPVCSDNAFTYSPTSLTSGAAFTWTRAAVSGISNAAITTPQTTNPNEILVNTTSSPIDVIYAYAISANGCTNTQNVRVTVNPTPTLSSTLTPAALCSNSTFSYTPTSATAGASFTWTRAAVPGISNPPVTTPQPTSPNEALANTTANPINVVYAFTITANGCSNTQNVTVRVNPIPTLNTTLTPGAICSGTLFSYTRGSDTPGASITWTRAAVSGISNAAVNTPQSSNPSETLVNTTPNPIDVVYVFTLVADGCSNTQNVTVRVNPSPVLSSESSMEICSGDNLVYTATSATPGTNFSWTRAAVAGISNAAASGTGDTVNETLVNTTAGPIDVVYAFTLSANGCTTTQNVTVTVKPSPTLSSATSVQVCDSEEFSYTATSATPGVSYLWTRAVVAGISNPAGNGTGATITETLVNTTAAPIDVVYELTLSVNGCSNTQSVTVTVNPTPTLDSSLTPPAICNNTPFTYSPSSATAGATFTWTRAAVAGISNPAVTTPQSSNPNETLVNTTPSPVDVIYTYTIAANGCTNVQTVTVRVNPTPAISAMADSVCSGDTFTVSPLHGTNGIVPVGISYTWTVADNPNVTGESNQASPQTSISQSLTNNSANPQTVIYTVTPISGACAGAPFTLTMTVNGDTRIETQPSTDAPEVCFGDTFSPISVVAGGAAGLTYQWYSNTTATNSGGVAVPGANSATFTPPSSVEGEAYYYVVVTGPCTAVTSEVTGRYLVTPPVITVLNPLDTTPQTICPGDNFTSLTFEASGANLTYQWYSNSTASTTGGTSISGANASTFTPSNTDFGPVYYYATASSDCGTVTSSVSGAFAITGSTSSQADQTLCVDTPLSPVITHTTTGTTGIANNGVAGANGLPPGVSASWNAGVITISGTPTSAAGSPYNYSIPLVGACGSEAATGTITVNPKAVISNLTASICTGGSFSVTPVDGTDGAIPSGTTYTWTAPVMSTGLSGGAAGSGVNISGTLVNSTSTAQTATYTVTPRSGSCQGPTFTVTVTVNPSPAIPAQTATICDGETFTVTPLDAGATRVPSGTVYTWTVVDNPNITGESNQVSALPSISQTLANSSNLPQNVVYTVTPTAGTCAGNAFTLTVTVNPNPEIPDQTAAVCSGSAFSVSPANGGGTVVPAGTTYTWTVVDNANVTGEVNQGSAQPSISQTLTNLTNIPQAVEYTVTPRSGAAGNCVGSPFRVSVTVNPAPQIVAQSQTICSGEAFSVSPANGGGNIVPAGTAYTWTVVDNPNVTGETTQTTAQASISQTLTNTSNSPQNVVYTVAPQSGAAGSCAGSTFTVTVTVNPTPKLSSTLTPTDICSNSAFTYSPSSAVTGTIFTWTRAAVVGISNPAITTPQNSNPNEVLENTTSNTIDVVYLYTLTANGCSSTEQVTVRVKPTPTLSSPTSSTICSNTAFAYSPSSNTTGTTFTWTRAAVPGISNPAVTVPQSSNPNETLINTTASAIDVVYTFTATANGCPNTQNVTVRVNPRPTLSSSLNPDAICSGTAFTYTPASLVPGAAFTWTRASVAGISNPAITTPQMSNPNEELVNTTPNPIDVVYAYTITANGCTNTENVRVTVKPSPTLSTTLTPAAICSGSEFNYTAATATSGTTITWTRAAVAGISNPAISTPQTSNPKETLTNTTASPIPVVYAFTLSANGCTNTQNVTVTVNPTPTLSSSLTPAAVCSSSPFTYTPTSNTPSASFSWTRAAVAGISNAAGSGTGNINETLVNTTGNPVNVVYVYAISANGCNNTQSVTVTVSPRPAITPSSIPTTICSGDTFSVTPANGTNGIVPAGTTYTWTRVDNTNVTGDSNQSTPQTSISQTLTNNTSSVQTVTYTVTPRAGTCAAGPTFQVVVTVNPTPTVSAVSNQTRCDGAATAAITFNGSAVAGTTYTWVNDNPSIGLAASGTGNIPSFTAVNNGVAPVTANITVTPRANECAGTPRTFTITVNPTPKVTVVPDYCVVGGQVQLIANSNVPGSTFLWNTGETTSSILVDLSGQYTVTVTTPGPNSCSTSESIGIAQELVTDGSFTNFDPNNLTFTTGYSYRADNPSLTDELVPEGRYGVGTNARNYHTNFWGNQDRTNNSTGPRNMMIINGYPGSNNTTIWQQTVVVEPNTEYYFTASAMSLNAVPPYARLRFEVNGVQVGTIANLTAGVNNNSNNGWQRFYSDPVWNSGSVSGPITIRIVNLEPAAGGNDFALDDISFGTLKPFIVLTSYVGSDNQTVCQNSPIDPITYNAGSGIFGPEVTGLPAGVTAVWNGVELQLIGSPTVSGVFPYTVRTTGTCVEASVTGTITVRATPTAGAIAANQTVCAGQDPAILTSVTNGTGEAGSTISYRWESNTNLTTPNWTVISGQTGATYDPPVVSGTTQYRRTTLATLNGLTCESLPTTPVQVTLQNTPTSGSIAGDQTICQAGDPSGFTSIVAGSGDGIISYRWESSISPFSSWNTISGAVSPTYDVPAGLTATTRFRRVTISTLNGVACESIPTAPVQVTVNPAPTPGSIAADQAICAGEDPAAFTSLSNGTGTGTIYYIWESSVSPYSTWTEINGANLATYDAPAGLTVTTRYRRTTVATSSGIECRSLPTTPVQVTILPNNTVQEVDPDHQLCVDEYFPPIIIHNTTGVTGLVPESSTVDYNLPNGVVVNWAAGATAGEGVVTISGTPTETGIFDYRIPLSGGCGDVDATGTLTVANPSYPITHIDVVNPSSGTPPYTSTFTVYSAELTLGTYEINYSIDGINAGPDQTIVVEVTIPGQFTFTSPSYVEEGTSIITINSIRKSTDLCPYFPPNNNTAPYGVGCSTEFLQSAGDATFFVPANVSQVTVQAFGDGSPIDTETVNVISGGLIFVVVDGNDIFATEVPASATMAERKAQAIVLATGPNGRVVFHFDCNTAPPCDASMGNPYEYIDSEGFTVLRFDVGSCEWHAPDGLDEFEILVVGGGGGGGFGNAAGGGGGGAVIYQHYTGITMNGLPGLQGAVFPLVVGDRGMGALNSSSPGENGDGSSFTGPAFSYGAGNTFSPINSAGGGGGGSSNTNSTIRQGQSGASGGGGAAEGINESIGGSGTAGNNGGNAFGEITGIGGGGGGGAAGAGSPAALAGIMEGGNGGTGAAHTISGEQIFYGAGGGGTSAGAVTNQAGAGGSPYSSGGVNYFAGGSASNHDLGQSPTTYGSGGGAGALGGSRGFPGVVYIRFPNYRVLSVEYLNFNAKHNPVLRSGDLTWATAREWENDRFVVERSINNANEWQPIGQVNGAGYSDGPTNYEFQDLRLPLSGGNIFYRLKQLDFDGDLTYSVTRSIRVEALEGTSYWRVFPNPTTGDPISLELLDAGAYQDEEVTVRIISPTGQYDIVTTKAGLTLNSLVSQQLRNRAAGLYTLEISWASYREYHKVVLRR